MKLHIASILSIFLLCGVASADVSPQYEVKELWEMDDTLQLFSALGWYSQNGTRRADVLFSLGIETFTEKEQGVLQGSFAVTYASVHGELYAFSEFGVQYGINMIMEVSNAQGMLGSLGMIFDAALELEKLYIQGIKLMIGPQFGLWWSSDLSTMIFAQIGLSGRLEIPVRFGVFTSLHF